MAEFETFDLESSAAGSMSIDDIETENVTLQFMGIDGSGSMYGDQNDMQEAMTFYKSAIAGSKQADEILVCRADFADHLDMGGYLPADQLSTAYSAHGMTALYDVIVEGKKKLVAYMEYLRSQGVRVKAIFSVFSDGEDTISTASQSEARKAIEELNNLEITTAFIGFRDGKGVGESLHFKNNLDVTEKDRSGQASFESQLRNAFDCLSKSVISSSKSLAPDNDAFFQM